LQEKICDKWVRDHIRTTGLAFAGKMCSCLVNPRACHETELNYYPTPAQRRFAVVGAGPAGLSAATTLAERGHEVHLFDAAAEIGGQLNMAKVIPGKEEFHEMLRYFRKRLELTGVQVHLGARVSSETLAAQGFDQVIVATGVLPRDPRIPGQEQPKVLNYVDVLRHRKPVGRKVAIIGAGGIGFDVAEFLVQDAPSPTTNLAEWLAEWGVTDPAMTRGGVTGIKPRSTPAARDVILLQRKSGKMGAGLGKTTGWIHRATLKMKGVQMIDGVNYERIEERGLLITYGEKRETPTWLDVDNIILCAGQESLRDLMAPLAAANIKTHLIGGADQATELDAKRAIDQGCRLAAGL
jgi:2,4-dienoyl-CoA reductase (NADPH2)